jgi:hypothetical protein
MPAASSTPPANWARTGLDSAKMGRSRLPGGDCPDSRAHRDEAVLGENGTVPFARAVCRVGLGECPCLRAPPKINNRQPPIPNPKNSSKWHKNRYSRNRIIMYTSSRVLQRKKKGERCHLAATPCVPVCCDQAPLFRSESSTRRLWISADEKRQAWPTSLLGEHQDAERQCGTNPWLRHLA